LHDARANGGDLAALERRGEGQPFAIESDEDEDERPS